MYFMHNSEVLSILENDLIEIQLKKKKKHTTPLNVAQYQDSLVKWKQIQYVNTKGNLAAIDWTSHSKGLLGQPAISLLSEVRHRPITHRILSS